MAAADVSTAVARTAASEPVNGIFEIAGPEVFTLDEWVRRVLDSRHDRREVVADPKAVFYGGIPAQTALLPGPDARLAQTSLAAWLAADTRK
jgi:uncharacterized protein YbjT (DUF2867 family)